MIPCNTVYQIITQSILNFFAKRTATPTILSASLTSSTETIKDAAVDQNTGPENLDINNTTGESVASKSSTNVVSTVKKPVNLETAKKITVTKCNSVTPAPMRSLEVEDGSEGSPDSISTSATFSKL